MPFLLAYQVAVSVLQTASAASKYSCAPGAESFPPDATDMSAASVWFPIRRICAYSFGCAVSQSIVMDTSVSRSFGNPAGSPAVAPLHEGRVLRSAARLL